MEQNQLRRTLETASYVAVLLVALTALSTFAIRHFVESPTVNLRPGVEKGKLFAQIPNLDYKTSTQTLLIFLNTDCRYCQDSVPFYRNLLEVNRNKLSVHIVAIFPNRPDQVDRYKAENQLSVETMSGVQLKSLGVSGTPSIVLLDQQGAVLNFWVGKLAVNDAAEVIRSLAS